MPSTPVVRLRCLQAERRHGPHRGGVLADPVVDVSRAASRALSGCDAGRRLLPRASLMNVSIAASVPCRSVSTACTLSVRTTMPASCAGGRLVLQGEVRRPERPRAQDQAAQRADERRDLEERQPGDAVGFVFES